MIGGDRIKVYLDLVIFLNIFLDFILLVSLSIVLKRRTSFKRIVLGSLVGGLSIFLLFVSFTSFQLFIIKLIISILMVLVTFGYKDIKYVINNVVYLYLLSIILGGFLYLLKVEFSYSNSGSVFFKNEFSINFVVLIIISPIILYI